MSAWHSSARITLRMRKTVCGRGAVYKTSQRERERETCRPKHLKQKNRDLRKNLSHQLAPERSLRSIRRVRNRAGPEITQRFTPFDTLTVFLSQATAPQRSTRQRAMSRHSVRRDVIQTTNTLAHGSTPHFKQTSEETALANVPPK